jgi:MFS family permease
MIFLGGNAILVLSGVLTGLGHGFLFPSLNALAIRNEKMDIKGKINGVFSGGIDTGAFIGSIMLGYIANWVGFQALFFVAGLALFMGLGMFAWRWDIIASKSSQAIADQVP